MTDGVQIADQVRFRVNFKEIVVFHDLSFSKVNVFFTDPGKPPGIPPALPKEFVSIQKWVITVQDKAAGFCEPQALICAPSRIRKTRERRHGP
jgi:hypothetical protein